MAKTSTTLPPPKYSTVLNAKQKHRKTRKLGSLLSATLTRNAILALRNNMNRTPVMNTNVFQKVKEVAAAGLGVPDKPSINFGTEGEGHPVTASDVIAPFPAERPPRSHCIRVKSHEVNDGGVVYEIRDDETFEAIYSDYASRVDLKPADIILRKNHIVISPTYTAAQMFISNLDVLHVTSVVPGRNLNTRLKHFYVRNTCNPPLEVLVQAKKTTRIRRIYQRWGARINRDPDRIMMMHQDVQLSKLDRIMDTAIKNLDVVTAFPSPM